VYFRICGIKNFCYDF